MAREDYSQERDIDAWKYKVTPLGFSEGQKALMRFLRIAGPVMGRMAQAMGGGIEKAGMAALEALPALVSDEDVEYFKRVFGPLTDAIALDGSNSYYLETKPGKAGGPSNLDTNFSNRYGAFFRWLAFCLEVNFAGFFADVMPKFVKGTASATPTERDSSSTASSGSSGVF